MKKAITHFAFSRMPADFRDNETSVLDPVYSSARGVNLLSLYISVWSMVGAFIFYLHTRSAAAIWVGFAAIVVFYLLSLFNYWKKYETANVFFYLWVNSVSLMVGPFLNEPEQTMLIFFFLLSLIVFLFETLATRLICMVIILTRIILFQINAKYVLSNQANAFGLPAGTMRWVVNGLLLSLIIFVFVLYALKLIKADELNEKNSLFFQHMSHDLQTSYYSVASICALLKIEVDKHKSVKDEPGIVDELINASSFCSYVLNNFLEYSKFENGTLHSNHYEKMDLGYEIEKIVALHKYITEEQNIRIQVSIDDDFPGLITSDRIKVNRIFLNLLSNAIKNTPPGKSIAVRIEPDKGKWKLSVINEGKGLNEEAMQNLFLPYPANGMFGRQVKLGLGLPITKVLVEALGGKIMATSRMNEETSFTVAIPYQ